MLSDSMRKKLRSEQKSDSATCLPFSNKSDALIFQDATKYKLSLISVHKFFNYTCHKIFLPVTLTDGHFLKKSSPTKGCRG